MNVGDGENDFPTNPMTVSLSDVYNSEELTQDPGMRARLKRKIMKNVVLIGFTFLLLFTSYNGLGALQSSLHKDEGMGTVTQSVLYGAMVLSSLFTPKLLISLVGHKWTMPISMSGYVLWMAANGYAVWGTMVPASILVGICAAPLWTAQSAYLTKVAPLYCSITGETTEIVVSRFFGIFFCIFQLSSLIGSIISSTILRPPGGPNYNNTLTQDEVYEYCGSNDCPWNNITNPGQAKPDDKTLWTMVGVYMGIACCAVVLVSAFVDNLPNYTREEKTRTKKEVGDMLAKTTVHLKNKYQLLLIPATVFAGLGQGFNYAEWNMSYISCSLGIWMVGLVQIPGSIVNAIMSFSGGYLVKFTGRIPVLTFGFFVQLTLQLVLLLWPIEIDKEYVFYILSAMWGIWDGVWQTQINAFYGVLFPENPEPAFANYTLWVSVGFIMAFAWSNFLCTDVKLYILMSVLCVGMVLYYTIEIMLRRETKGLLVDSEVNAQVTSITLRRFERPMDNTEPPLSQVHKSVKNNEAFIKTDENYVM